MLLRRSLIVLLGLVLGSASVGRAGEENGSTPATAVDFVRDIRPIFSKRCYSCHGPDMAESSLRLDRKQDALRGGSGGPIVVAGSSVKSRLIGFITGDNPDQTVMPPEGERLSAEEVALVRRWIEQGALWPESADAAGKGTDHWSFQPLRVVEPPQVRHASAVRNPIDGFILQRLEAQGFEPAAEADRSTLIRRASIDLLGLPPEPEEVEAFLKDDRPQAYERMIERLLESPHYGERWARHWLDLARYADSDGYEKDTGRPHAWRYRSWVIDALNRDLPFDEFTRQQLAGDLLPNPTTDMLIATGFHRNTLTNKEGGVDQEEFRVAATVDRVNTTGAVWLGLTVGCAQCHSHKYDPLSQREYFELFAFFNNLQEVDLPAPSAEQQATYARALEEHRQALAPRVAARERFERDEAPSLRQTWEQTWRERPPAKWTPAEVEQATATNDTVLKIEPAGTVVAEGTNPNTSTFTLTLRLPLDHITTLRLEALADDALPKRGPGRSTSGNFLLTDVKLTAAPLNAQASSPAAKPINVPLRAAYGSVSPQGQEPALAIDADAKKTGWGSTSAVGRDHVLLLEPQEPIVQAGGVRLTITLEFAAVGGQLIGRQRWSATDGVAPIRHAGVDSVAEILTLPDAERNKEQRQRLERDFLARQPAWVKLNQAVIEQEQRTPVDPGTTNKAQTLAEVSTPRKTHILVRGDFLRPGAEVSAGTPAVLPPIRPRGTTLDRLDLANWLVDRQNPLTPRVIVNRFWELHFGRGLVNSSADFGTQGELPSHPELLDWLAAEFMRQGWSMKRLHALILTSGTYRQSSRNRAEFVERDPYNVWLARLRRLRVEAEIVRDLSLAVSGLLDRRIGGTSVRPKQPAGVSELTYANSAKWVESTGGDRFRRGLYTWFQRTSPYPMLMTFDAPDSNLACTRRERSNTPLQALTLLNDPVFFECAQAFGRRLVARPEFPSQSLEARLRRAFFIALAREPNERETAALADLYREQVALGRADPAAIEALIGSTPRPAGVEPAELAAWIVIGRTLLNVDEFITRE